MSATGDAAVELPMAERSQFEKFTELLTTLFPVWVRPTPFRMCCCSTPVLEVQQQRRA